jgi:anti-sigma B factor antagonist
MSSANLSVLVGKNFRLHENRGPGQFCVQPRFQNAAERAGQKGYKHFIIDLSECVLMDSTFLGVLAGFGMKLNPKGAPAERGIELHNATRAWRTAGKPGRVHLFKITTGPLQLPDDKTCTPESINPTHEEITRTSLEAHQTLMAMNPGKCRAVQGRGAVSGRGFEVPEKSSSKTAAKKETPGNAPFF